MAEVEITSSSRKGKRLMATFGPRTVHFGSDGQAFVDHKDPEIKAAWEARHRVREDWADPTTAGALAKHVLWNKPTIQASIKDLNKRQSDYRFIYK